jgi:hypothetical protein
VRKQGIPQAGEGFLALGKILPPKQSHITDLSKIKKMERFSHK